MTYTTLISPTILSNHLDDPVWAIFDCRFSLGDKDSGRRSYLQAHIPGAVYVHLEDDLSAAVIPGQTGRHPLDSPDKVVRAFSRLGIRANQQIVAYDDSGGTIGAARLWWMLRWMGVQSCAVLNGGWQAWQQAGLPVCAGDERLPPSRFDGSPHPELLATAEQTDAIRLKPNWKLLDVRSAERYYGKNETIDPVAGHIPGALNAPYAANLSVDGAMRSKEELHRLYSHLLGPVPASHTVVYCGSGVSAAHTLLAIEHAGLGAARLYPGSWSDWITNPKRPIEAE
jgi:thiosulfate/3-mercaptopyruvate sulfurtransferase